MTNILIAEDNLNIVSNYQSFFTKDKGLSILDCAEDGEKALQLYNEKKPDILLLDLGLPRKDGLSVIEDLSLSEGYDRKCNIIVISGENSLRTNILNTKKVFKVIHKPCSLDTILDAIREFEKEQNKKEFPVKDLNHLFFKLNLKVHSSSCNYLTDVIKYAYYRPYMLNNIKNIYKIVALQYNCNHEAIRSSIRSTIRTVKNCKDKELMKSIFFVSGSDYNKIISPCYLVECMVEYLNSVSSSI